MNKWKVSTIVLASVLAGFLLAQFTGSGGASAQSGGIAKLQLDTSNCTYGVAREYSLPPGAFVVQAQPSSVQSENLYVYNVCK